MIESLKSIHRIFSAILLVLTVIVCITVPIIDSTPDPGYESIWIMPIAFLLCLIALRYTADSGYYLTRMCFELYSFIRYVLNPFLSVITGIYSAGWYLTKDANYISFSIWLIIIEVVLGTAFFVVLCKLNIKQYFESSHDLSIKGNKFIYFTFIILAIGLYLFVGREANLVQFGVISGEGTYEDITGSELVLIRHIIKIALFLIFLLATDICQNKFTKSNSIMYFITPLLFGVLNIITIVGQRRSEQLIMAVLVFIILLKAFPRFEKFLIISIPSVFIVMMLYLTLYKSFLNYGMNVSVQTGFSLEFITSSFQSYYGGIQNMAETLLFSDNSNLTLSNFLYDIARSLFGINFLFRDYQMMTVELFNTFIYGIIRSNGHAISSTGYSCLYFTPLFCFLCLWFNLFIASKTESIVLQTNSFEIVYMFLYIFVRFGMNLYASIIPLITFSTMILGTIGLLYFVASHVRIGLTSR